MQIFERTGVCVLDRRLVWVELKTQGEEQQEMSLRVRRGWGGITVVPCRP